MNLNNFASSTQRVDTLAYQFAKTRNEEYLTDLVTLLMPKLEKHAEANSRKFFLPKEDLFSAYLEALHEAAKEYDIKKNRPFEMRWHVFKNRKGTDVLKHYMAEKRNTKNTYSLNVTHSTSDDGNVVEYGDTFMCHNSDFTRRTDIETSFSEFVALYPEKGEILKMCRTESNLEVARFLGEESYNEKARKKVSLARRAFQRYYNK